MLLINADSLNGLMFESNQSLLLHNYTTCAYHIICLSFCVSRFNTDTFAHGFTEIGKEIWSNSSADYPPLGNSKKNSCDPKVEPNRKA